MLNEVIRTTGDIRRLLANSMQEVRNGQLKVSEAQAIAALARELTGGMQTEINAAKLNMLLKKEGMAVNKISHMGQMLIGDENVPTLYGASE